VRPSTYPTANGETAVELSFAPELYMKDGELCFRYNYVGLDRFEVLAEDGGLTEGRQALRYECDGYETGARRVQRDGETVAEISRRWLRVRDAYGIEVAPGQDDALILAITVCIERMGHD
jgi:hypothetical protein